MGSGRKELQNSLWGDQSAAAVCRRLFSQSKADHKSSLPYNALANPKFLNFVKIGSSIVLRLCKDIASDGERNLFSEKALSQKFRIRSPRTG